MFIMNVIVKFGLLVALHAGSVLTPANPRQAAVRKAALLGRGVEAIEASGYSALTMRDKQWREGYLPTHVASRDSELRACFQTWKKTVTTPESFEAWITREKGADWFHNRSMVREGELINTNVTYLDDPRDFEIEVENGRLVQQGGVYLAPEATFNLVLSASKKMYGLVAKIGRFTHASLSSGGGLAFAGEISVNGVGKIVRLSNSSGHYVPEMATVLRMIRELQAKGADLSELSEIVVRDAEKNKTTFRSVHELFKSIRSLEGSSTVELLDILNMLEEEGIDTSEISVKGRPLAEFLQSLTVLEASRDQRAIDSQIAFLARRKFDFSQIKAITSPLGVSAMRCVRTLTPFLDPAALEFQVQPVRRLKPLTCTFHQK